MSDQKTETESKTESIFKNPRRWIRPTVGIGFAIIFSAAILLMMHCTMSDLRLQKIASQTTTTEEPANSTEKNPEDGKEQGQGDSTSEAKPNDTIQNSGDGSAPAIAKKVTQAKSETPKVIALVATLAAQVAALALILSFAGKILRHE